MGASNVVQFPSRLRQERPRVSESLEALSSAICEHAKKQGIALRQSTVQMIVEGLASAPDVTPGDKDQ